MLPVILLDLNFTLVSNSDQKISPFIKQIASEEYRQWLVDLIRPYRVFLVTARPPKYQGVTLARIMKLTGWLPERSYFNTYNLRPPMLKERVLKEHLFKEFAGVELYAIESNPQTRAMYTRNGVPSIAVPKEGIWTELPTII